MNSGNRALLLVTLLLLAVAATKAQSFEIPNIEHAKNLCELRDENRVFVHAPLNTRQELVKELSKHSDLVIVERPEEAEFFLIFAYAHPVEGSTSALNGGNAETASAEMTVLKLVSDHKEGLRPRILLYWSEQRSVHSLPVPLTNSMSPGGFHGPRSGKSAIAELITRLTLWAVGKKWPNHLQFDQFTNQLTINIGGKLEKQGAKWFLKQLKNARSSPYAATCMAQPLALSTPSTRLLRSDSTPAPPPEPLLAPGSRPPMPVTAPGLLRLPAETTPARRPKRVAPPRRRQPSPVSARGSRNLHSRSGMRKRPSLTRVIARTALRRRRR